MRKKKRSFSQVFAESNDDHHHMFSLEDEGDQEIHDTCVLQSQIDFFGVDEDADEDFYEKIYVDDRSDLTKIGSVNGTLILYKEIEALGEDPLAICDDLDGDLEFTISALREKKGPLSIKKDSANNNVFYIRDFVMMEEFAHDQKLKSKILQQLPEVIFALLHARPGILAYIPEMPRSPEQIKRDEERARAFELVDINAEDYIPFSNPYDFISDEHSEDRQNPFDFGRVTRYSEDEINEMMGRRTDKVPYPEELKNREEFDFFEANGFMEAGETRLLYKKLK